MPLNEPPHVRIFGQGLPHGREDGTGETEQVFSFPDQEGQGKDDENREDEKRQRQERNDPPAFKDSGCLRPSGCQGRRTRRKTKTGDTGGSRCFY